MYQSVYPLYPLIYPIYAQIPIVSDEISDLPTSHTRCKWWYTRSNRLKYRLYRCGLPALRAHLTAVPDGVPVLPAHVPNLCPHTHCVR